MEGQAIVPVVCLRAYLRLKVTDARFEPVEELLMAHFCQAFS